MSIRASATWDLLQRYSRVFRGAWRARKELEPAKRLPHEAQFLPAALALQETPLSTATYYPVGTHCAPSNNWLFIPSEVLSHRRSRY